MEAQMLKKVLLSITLFIILFSSKILFADTIPGGDVSGIWFADSSPYYINGSITIPAGDTLVIEPGVEVNFLGFYSLTVNGLLDAIGTETDSIHFTTSTFWRGLNFTNAPDSSKLAFCTIRHSGTFFTGMGGINCTNSNPVITHCRISDNYAHDPISTYAGGIALNNSNAEISWCDISHNRSESHGGGMNIYNSSPVITGCNISDNRTVMYGGGIWITGNSSPMITNCTIEADTSNMYGGGIAVAGGVITISECTISRNRAHDGGGGLMIGGGSVFLDHCIIERNNCLYTAADGKGGGIFTNGGVLTVDHCTFYCNEVDVQIDPYGMEIHTEGNAAMTVTNSIFLSLWNFWTIVFNSTFPASVSYDDFKGYEGSGTYRFMGNVPPGLGVLTQVNYNGDSCDVYYNIYLDPLFVDWWNLHLTDSSFCIDAGDPASPYDPDSTITDMGRYFYDQRMPDIELSATLLDFGSVMVSQSVDLPLVIYNLGDGNLLLSDFHNSLTEFTNNWNPLDSLILPNDSLEVMVTFAPDDTVSYSDTLWIDNNDTLCYVTLTGEGEPLGISDNLSLIPREFVLGQALPNPCKSATKIQFSLPKASKIDFSIYDISGRLVSVLASGQYEPGIHEVQLDASGFGSGVYFYRLKTSGFTAIKKVVITK
jgi:hypothetical protein